MTLEYSWIDERLVYSDSKKMDSDEAIKFVQVTETRRFVNSISTPGRFVDENSLQFLSNLVETSADFSG